jgi:hypothetical protein
LRSRVWPPDRTVRAVGTRPETPSEEAATEDGDTVELSPAARAAQRAEQLGREEQERVAELKQRDAEVRRHEAAHQAAAGAHAHGGAQFEYETGPDGRQYATAGEVHIDTSPIEDDPAATIRKMETVRAAALAPADPSAQDMRVAAEAEAAMQRARAEQAAATAEAARGSTGWFSGRRWAPMAPRTAPRRSDSMCVPEPANAGR